jgi:hypothetical protein
VTQGATQIVLGLGQLVSKQRQARVEDNQRRQREANKTPSDLFGTNIIKLMRWCQVTTEDQLPQVWRDLAQAPKGKQQQVLNRAVDEAVEALEYKNLNLQVTLAVSKRIFGLEWILFTNDDLGSGLHPFTVGYITPEQAEDQRKRNRMTDLIQSGEAAPSFNDAREITDSPEVHIPFLVTQALFTHLRFLALIQALLTTNHPLVQSYKEFVDEFTACKPELDRAAPETRSVSLSPPRSSCDGRSCASAIGSADRPAPIAPSQYLRSPSCSMTSHWSGTGHLPSRKNTSRTPARVADLLHPHNSPAWGEMALLSPTSPKEQVSVEAGLTPKAGVPAPTPSSPTPPTSNHASKSSSR